MILQNSVLLMSKRKNSSKRLTLPKMERFPRASSPLLSKRSCLNDYQNYHHTHLPYHEWVTHRLFSICSEAARRLPEALESILEASVVKAELWRHLLFLLFCKVPFPNQSVRKNDVKTVTKAENASSEDSQLKDVMLKSLFSEDFDFRSRHPLFDNLNLTLKIFSNRKKNKK